MKQTARYEAQPKYPTKIITYHFTNHAKIWRHWHEYLEIIYLVRGSLTLKADGNIIEVCDGDIAVFNPFEVHESISLSPENEYYVFAVPPEFLRCRQNYESIRLDSVIKNSRDCKSAIKKAAEYSSFSDDNGIFLLSSEIFRFLYFAAKDHSTTAPGATEYVEKNKHIVDDIKNRISYQ